MTNHKCDICGISYSPVFGDYFYWENRQQVCPKCADRRIEEGTLKPNEATRKAMAELKAGGGIRYESIDALLDSLEAAEDIEQILLPDPKDEDERPRLLLNGEGLHAGQMLTVLTPDGWREIRLEVSRNKTGVASWYIATEGYRHLCPIGLFVRLDKE